MELEFFCVVNIGLDEDADGFASVIVVEQLGPPCAPSTCKVPTPTFSAVSCGGGIDCEFSDDLGQNI